MVLIPKKNRVAIYSYLFKEGVMVAKETPFAPKHIELDVPNLHVLKEMKSLKSRGYITQQFNWGYFYWYLTNEGIEFLRSYLHLPDDIVPATLKKPKPAPRPAGAPRDGERRPPRFDRERAPADGDKKVGPSGSFQPRFGETSSYGRGRAEGGGRGFGGENRSFGAGRGGYRSESGGAGAGAGAGAAPGGERRAPSFGRGGPQ